MKNILLVISAFLLLGTINAQNIKPGVRSTFHAIDDKGKPISEELIEVEVTFSKKDTNGNKVPVYSEKFTEKTTKDGYFQREIGASRGDLPEVTFGEYKNVDFTDPELCVRVDFRRIEVFNPEWIIGKWEMLNPAPVATQVLNNDDGDQDDQNELQEIVKVGDEVKLSRDGGTVVLNDDDPTNELQILDYNEGTRILTLEGGNSVDLSGLTQFMENGNQLSTMKSVQASQFTTKNGQTDIEEGKISFRYANGFDGIEMGIDEEFCAPFISFIDCEGNFLGSFRMGPEGFKYYPN